MLPLTRRRQGFPPARPPDWSRAFGRRAPLEVDIGCGRGHFVLERAQLALDVDLVAIETKGKWIEEIREKVQSLGLTNLRAIRCDASFDLPLLFGPGTVSGFSLLHPDPWWKKRHRKRRLVRPAWIGQLTGMLAPGGWFFAQTDVPDMAAEIAQVLQAEERLSPIDADALLAEHFAGAQSHRSRRCADLGIPVKRVAFATAGGLREGQ